jgi:hypothetical protein
MRTPSGIEAAGGHSLVTAALAVLLTPVECVLMASLAWGYGLPAVLTGHLVILTAVGVWVLRPARRSARHPLLLWLSTAVFGPLGSAGVLLAMTLEWHYARRSTPVDQWHAMLFPPNQVDKHAELWRRVGRRASDRPATKQVIPFLDILAFGSIRQRQAVIALIAQRFDPAFAPALKAALHDEHNVIRVQAATAVAHLENQLLERTIALEAAVRDAPEDADAILALATHYDDQAFTGLLDAAREQTCRVKAASLYEQYLGQRPDDPPVELRLARLQLRRGLAAEATPRLRRLAESGHLSACLWLMESLFAQKGYQELRAVASRFADRPDGIMATEVSGTVELWAGRGDAA